MATSSHAAIIAHDPFTYANGNLNAQNGGTGWGGGWVATSTAESVVSNALRFTGNNNDAAVRLLSTPFSSTELYFAFDFRFVGTPNSNDFLAFWLDDGSSTGGHSSNTPNVGAKINLGPSSRDYNARFNIGGESYASSQLVVGQTVQLIGKLEKVGSFYKTLSLWVNLTPGITPVGPADATVTTAGSGYGYISRIGFRTANLDSGDSVTVDDLRLGTTLESVVAPEPASLLVWAGVGLAGLVAARRRKVA
jgi:hypothetical protein